MESELQKPTEILLREPKASDLNLIQATFLNSMKSESNLGRSCSKSVFFANFQQVIDHILQVSEVIVACHVNHPDVILGYVVFQQASVPILHYVFVKAAFRREGVAKALCFAAFPEAKAILHTMNTNSSKQICESKAQFIFNPFLLYKKGA